MNRITRFLVGFCSFVALSFNATAADKPSPRVYVNSLKRIPNPKPLLADYPQFVKPVKDVVHYEAPTLVDDKDADLSVRAWRWSYNARGVIEIPNRLRGDRTALIVVHPWGIDDGQGWTSPEPAGVAFQCTPIKNALCRKHAKTVINPLVQSLRKRVKLAMYSLPGKEDAIRRKLYRSFRNRTTAAARNVGQEELVAKLKSFQYAGKPLPKRITLGGQRPITADYFAQFPGLDASAKYNNAGFWEQPIPVMKDIDVGLNDVVCYDAEGYAALRTFLKSQGVRHVLLCGYNTDMCVCKTTAGWENLRKDFNVFLIGDATLATFPANSTPAAATNAAVSFASLNLLITQVSWIRGTPVTPHGRGRHP